MNATHTRSVFQAQPGGCGCAPVPALGSVTAVTKLLHQFLIHVGHVLDVEAGRGWGVRKPVAGHRGAYDMKCIVRPPAVRFRVGQGTDDLCKLKDRARPAMRDNERKSALYM